MIGTAGFTAMQMVLELEDFVAVSALWIADNGSYQVMPVSSCHSLFLVTQLRP